jgi:hypothetical protein
LACSSPAPGRTPQTGSPRCQGISSVTSGDQILSPRYQDLNSDVFELFIREDGGKSAARAAESTIWGSTSRELDGVTGRYFDTDTKEQKLHPTAYEPEVQARILAVIEAAIDRSV